MADAHTITDQPLQPPASHLERWTSALGNLARPFVLYAAGGSSALATVSIVWMRLDLIAGAAFIAASWGGVGVLYGAKALEERGKAKSEADIAIARPPTPAPAPAPTPAPPPPPAPDAPSPMPEPAP